MTFWTRVFLALPFSAMSFVALSSSSSQSSVVRCRPSEAGALGSPLTIELTYTQIGSLVALVSREDESPEEALPPMPILHVETSQESNLKMANVYWKISGENGCTPLGAKLSFPLSQDPSCGHLNGVTEGRLLWGPMGVSGQMEMTLTENFQCTFGNALSEFLIQLTSNETSKKPYLNPYLHILNFLVSLTTGTRR